MGDAGSTEAASGFIKSARRSATSPLGLLIAAAAARQNKEHGRREGRGEGVKSPPSLESRCDAASRGHFDKALK